MKRRGCLLALAALAGCGTVGPAWQRPDFALDQSFIAAAPSAAEPTEDDLNWWRRFDDPALAGWVERALAGNPDVAAAFENVRQAQALLRAARAARGPEVTGGVRATAARRSGSGASGNRSGGTAASGASAALELDLAWDADLWGGLRQAERSAAAALLRSEDLAQAARLATAGTAARLYAQWRAAQAESRLLQEAQQLQGDVLRIAQVRADAGLAPSFDVMRARADLAAARAERSAALADARAAELALHALAGERPGSAAPVRAARGDIPQLDGAVWVPRPADLLRLRPDVRAAEHALAGAFAEVGVAQAALYPRLRIPGQLLLTATGLAAGSAAQTLSASLSALLQAPLAGRERNRAQLDAARARARQAAQVYRKTVLEALQQAETALVAQQAAQDRIAALQTASDASATALRQARTLYAEGLAGFLDVLEAQRTWLDNRRALTQARADGARAAIAAFEAIGLIRPVPASR